MVIFPQEINTTAGIQYNILAKKIKFILKNNNYISLIKASQTTNLYNPMET